MKTPTSMLACLCSPSMEIMMTLLEWYGIVSYHLNFVYYTEIVLMINDSFLS
jgi:hypothetical protein